MRTIHTEAQLQQLQKSLVRNVRTDGTTFYSLADGTPEHLIDLVRECHNGELPNDWRYETIAALVQAMLEYSEPDSEPWDEDKFSDVSWEIAGNVVETGTSQLFQWLADNPSRAVFADDGIAALTTDFAALAQERQLEEINIMLGILAA